MGPKPIQDGQRERGGLAGTGLRGRKDVTTLKDERDGSFLDRRGGGIALLDDGLEQIGRQAEGVEGQAWLLHGSRAGAGWAGSLRARRRLRQAARWCAADRGPSGA